MYQYTIIQWLLFFFVYCLIGWLWETSYVSVRKHKFTNRGFLTGPFLPIYGFGVLAMLIATIPVKDNIPLIFLFGLAAATILEYFTGVVMEAIFKVRYWDYSNQKFNLNGHICLSSSIGWGVSSIIIVRGVHVVVADMVLSLPAMLQEGLALVLSIGFSVDMAFSVRDALDIKEILMRIKENNEEVQKLQRRMDVLIAVVDDEKQNLKLKLEQIMETRQEEENGYFGRKIENLKKRFDALEKEISQFEWKAKDKKNEEVQLEIAGIKEKIMLSVLKRDLGKRRIKGVSSRLLRRNPHAISRQYGEELDEMKNVKQTKLLDYERKHKKL